MNCENPQLIYNKYLGHKVLVPCGKCSCCRIQRSNMYAYRVSNECDKHTYNVFFTLQYSNDYLPLVKDGSKYLYLRRRNDTSYMERSFYTPDLVELVPLEVSFDCSQVPNNITCFNIKNDSDAVSNGQFRGVLYYPDVQSLLKRLRVALKYDIEKNKIAYENNETKDFVLENIRLRYVICGEYGGSFSRPHYHGILHTNSKTISEWFISNLSKYWIYQDWSVSRRKNKFGVDGMPSYTNSQSAGNYVSKYVAGFVSESDNMLQDLFRPFIKTSKNPYYGLSAFDENLVEKITLGDDVDSFQHIEKKSDKFVVVEPSNLCKDRLIKRFNGIDKISVEELSSDIYFGGESVLTPKGRVIKWFRKRMLKAFGNCEYHTILLYLRRVQRFLSYLFKVQLKSSFEEVGYNLREHAKRCYNTLANFYPKNDEFLAHNVSGLFMQLRYEKVGKPLSSLVSVLRNYDITDSDLLNIFLDRTFSEFATSRLVYKERYKKSLLPKHFNKSVDYYG